MDKYRKIAMIILIIMGCFFLSGSCFYLVRSSMQDKESREMVDVLKPLETTNDRVLERYTVTDKYIETDNYNTTDDPSDGSASDNMDTPSSDNTIEESPDNAESDKPEEPRPVENPYRDSYLANEDMAAWLLVPDTGIDYPVMWTPRDENYYLKRGFDGRDNENGCLILDTDSCVNPLTTNLIIHGHNMRSGAMFGNLTNYEDEEYCREHSRMYLYTPECQRQYEVIAVFRSQVYKKTDTVFKFYKFFQADTQEEFDDFYQNIKEMSIYDTGVTAEFGDCFLTLSTCAYHVDRGRFVVVAKEVENGDFYLPLTTEEQP